MNNQTEQQSGSNQQPVAPPPQAQPYPQIPQQPGQYMAPIENPGQTLGIIGLVLNFLNIHLGGIILGAMSRSKSKSANMSTAMGTFSLVWGIIGLVLSTFLIMIFVILMIIGIIAES